MQNPVLRQSEGISFDTHWDGNVPQVVNNLFPPELGVAVWMTPYHLGQAEARVRVGNDIETTTCFTYWRLIHALSSSYLY